MYLEIITPDASVFKGEVNGANFPGADGLFEVMNNHAPMISTLGKGKIKIYGASEEKSITVDGGIVEVLNNKIIVLAEAVVA